MEINCSCYSVKYQYIDELEVIGTNQPRRSSKFDMMSVVQEEEEPDVFNESMNERSTSFISTTILRNK